MNVMVKDLNRHVACFVIVLVPYVPRLRALTHHPKRQGPSLIDVTYSSRSSVAIV